MLDLCSFSGRSGAQVRGQRTPGGGSPATKTMGDMYDNQYNAYGQPQQPQQAPPQLFEDTSSQNYGYGNQGNRYTNFSVWVDYHVTIS